MKILEYTGQSTGIDLASSGSNSRLAQRFKLRHAAPIGIVSLYLKKTGSPSGYLYIEIQNDSSSQPSSSAIATSNGVDMASVSSSYGYVNFEFDMDSRGELVRNDSYHIVLRSSGYTYASGTTEVTWGCDQSTPSYINGEGETWDGSSWGNISTDTDFTFKLYTGNRSDDTYFSMKSVESLTRIYTHNGLYDYHQESVISATTVYDFGDDISNQIDAWLRGAGFSTPVTNTTARRFLKTYGNAGVAMLIEMTQRTSLHGERGAGTPAGGFKELYEDLRDGLKGSGEMVDTLSALGIGRVSAGQLGRGLTAGSIIEDERDDYLDDEDLVHWTFQRDMWNNP